MRFTIALQAAAKHDLKTIREQDRPAGVRLTHWLQTLIEDQDQDVLDRLTDQGYQDDDIDVQSIGVLQKIGINMWRLKISGEDQWLPYRVLYVFDHTSHIYHVLRVISRHEYNYQLNDPITKGCINEIERLGIPGLPGWHRC